MYKVFGYNCFCEDFSIEVASFVEAILLYQKLERELCVVFINGTSDKVKRRLWFPKQHPLVNHDNKNSELSKV